MVANRGYQSTSAKTRLRLVEAASAVLCEEGYPAFTARRIASRADLKPQLVHYYFRSMEELVVTVFQLSNASYFRQHDEALSGPRPLHALWQLNCNLSEGQRMLEYVALGKIYPALRNEMRSAGERYRQQQIEAIATIWARHHDGPPPIAPEALAALMSAVARTMVIEGNVGFTTAHEAVRAHVESILAIYEPV